MSPRYRSSFAAPTGFVAAVTRSKPHATSVARQPAPRAPALDLVSDGSKSQHKAA